MNDAINVTLIVVVVALFLASNDALAAQDFDADYYSECTLKNVKAGMDTYAVQVIQQACKLKATPKKCRALPDETPNGLNLLGSPERSKCVDACKSEGFYSRYFGDCSTG